MGSFYVLHQENLEEGATDPAIPSVFDGSNSVLVCSGRTHSPSSTARNHLVPRRVMLARAGVSQSLAEGSNYQLPPDVAAGLLSLFGITATGPSGLNIAK